MAEIWQAELDKSRLAIHKPHWAVWHGARLTRAQLVHVSHSLMTLCTVCCTTVIRLWTSGYCQYRYQIVHVSVTVHILFLDVVNMYSTLPA